MKALFTTFYWLFFVSLVGIGFLLLSSLIPGVGLGVKVVKSGSMEPAIHTGAIVLIKREAAYHVGDVVTFGADTKTQIPTTHRIVAITNDANPAYQTKGDANDAEDHANTHLSDIHGKVIVTVPYVGYVLEFAKTALGFALLIGVPALIIVLDEIIKIVREVRRMRTRRKNGGNDLDDRGGPPAPPTRMVPPPISSRGRSMDGIRMSEVLGSDVRRMHKKPYLTSVLVLVLMFSLTSYVMPVGRTLSYLSNHESTNGNEFTASSVDLELGKSDDPTAPESYLHAPEEAKGYVDGAQGETLKFSFATYAGPGSPAFFYIGKGLFADDVPTGCSVLQLKAHFGSYSYEGPLNAFVSPATSTPGFWDFEITLPAGETLDPPGSECKGSLVFYAQPLEKAGVLDGVFSDTETFNFEAYSHEAPVVESAALPAPADTSTPPADTPPADPPADTPSETPAP